MKTLLTLLLFACFVSVSSARRIPPKKVEIIKGDKSGKTTDPNITCTCHQYTDTDTPNLVHVRILIKKSQFAWGGTLTLKAKGKTVSQSTLQDTPTLEEDKQFIQFNFSIDASTLEESSFVLYLKQKSEFDHSTGRKLEFKNILRIPQKQPEGLVLPDLNPKEEPTK